MQQLVQQRAAQMEVEDQRRQVQELTASKKQLQNEVNTLKERLDAEILAKNDEIGAFFASAMHFRSLMLLRSHQAKLASSFARTRDHIFLHSDNPLR